ncbi:MAG TPA: hypothetical protein VK453_06765 [Micromonosporaceae bacterium]|nr:hypothetical protein [Micromonosporaceae bacterium]
MRAFLTAVGVVAVVLIILGLVLKAVKWLLIIGVIALLVAIGAGILQGRRTMR